MDTAQEALTLVLNQVGVRPNIKTKSERKTVQKAVYLAQAAGVDLGYRYNWYVHGPYSPSLTKDYFALQETLTADPEAAPVRRLSNRTISKLEKIPDLIKVPADASDLVGPDWMELLASVHFLSTALGLGDKAVGERLQAEKPHVAGYYEVAITHLKSVDLL